MLRPAAKYTAFLLFLAGSALAQDVTAVAADPAQYGAFTGGVPTLDGRAAAARAFYTSHADAYDFIVAFPKFPLTFTQATTGESVGLHAGVRNDVTGIGQPLFDRGAQFGSGARLKAFIDVTGLRPGDTRDVENAVGTIAHEVAHQWSGHVRVRDAQGQASTQLLGRDGAHWSYFLSSDASVLYGSEWMSSSATTYVAKTSRKRYSALDLYLMGLLGAAEVPAVTLLVPAATETAVATDLPPVDGKQVQVASVRTLTIADITAIEGARAPDAAIAQRTFRAAFIIPHVAGSPPTAAELAFVEAVRTEWANRFFFLTRGRAVMETDLVERPHLAQPGPGTLTALQYVLAHQNADGSFSDDAATRTRDSQVVAEALRTFATAQGVPAASASLSTAFGSWTLANADDEARRVLGLRALNQPSASRLSSLSSYAVAGSGFALAPGYRASPLDTLLVGSAFGADLATSRASEAVAFLLSKQNADGGFPAVTGGPSRVDATSLAIRWLKTAPPSAAISAAIGQAASFLGTRRDPSGLFGDDRVSEAATAHALLALFAANTLTPSAASEAERTLLSLQRADGSWNGSLHDTALVIQALRTVRTTNLVISAADVVAARSTAVDGETVSVNVTIRNNGFADSGAVTIQLYGDDGTPLAAALSVSNVVAGAAATISATIDSSGHAGNQNLFAVVDPANAIDEGDETDNRAVVPFTITGPPPGVDLSVSSVTVTSGSITGVPAAVAISVKVSNLGQTDAANAAIALRVGQPELARGVVSLSARQSATVTLSASLQTLPLPSPLRVIADPDDAIVEANEANNSATVPLQIVPTVDLAVTSLAVSTTTATQGDDVVATVAFTNRGTQESSGGKLRWSVKDASGADVTTIPELAVALLPAGTDVRTFTWRATRSGVITISAELTASNETMPANNSASVALNVTGSAKPNLFIGAGGITLQPDPLARGKPGTVAVSVSNNGGSDSAAFDVTLYDGDPAAGGFKLGTARVSSVAKGASAWSSFAWTPTVSGSRTLVVQVDSASEVDEFDEDDNLEVKAISILSLPDLRVANADLSFSNSFPVRGATVQATLSVLNEGEQDAQAASVSFYRGQPNAGGVLLASVSLPAITAGTRAQVSTTVATAGLSGPVTIVAVVNGNRAAEEDDYGNNSAERTMVVQTGALIATNPFFSPNGDGVKDFTALILGTAGDTSVTISNQEGVPVRVLQSSAGLTWDGRSEDGGIVPDGTYQATVAATADAGAQSVAIVVDTNRRSLEAALGTNLLARYDLGTTVSTQWSPFIPMPDESGSLTYDEQWVCCNNFGDWYRQNGFYVVPNGGGARIKLSPESWEGDVDPRWPYAVSPDGTRIAYFRNEFWFRSYSARHELIEFDRRTQTFKAIATPNWTNHQFEFFARLSYSSDGTEIAVTERRIVNGQWKNEVAAYLSGVSGSRRLIATLQSQPQELQYSPDGRWIAVKTSDLQIIPAGGGAPTTLVPNYMTIGGSGPKFTWMPDSDRLAFWFIDAPPTGWYPGLRARAVRSVSRTNGNQALLWELPSSYGGPAVDHYRFGAFQEFGIESAHVALSPTGELAAVGVDTAGFVNETLLVPLNGASSFQRLEVGTAFNLNWSPHGSLLHLSRNAEEGNTSSYPSSQRIGHFAYASLGNLGTRIAARRPSGSAGIQFFGTAADHDFDSFDVAVRSHGGSAQLVTVAGGTTSVVNSTLGEWSPPNAGVYDAVLTARDLAGNVRERSITFAASAAPTVGNLKVSPPTFSPNGDGKLDSTLVTYSVSAPVSLDFVISNVAQMAVRHVSATHLTAENGSFVWDGRDDNGNVLADGNYTVSVETVIASVAIDTAPPVAIIGYGSPDIEVPKAAPEDHPTLIANLAWRASGATGCEVQADSANAPGVFSAIFPCRPDWDDGTGMRLAALRGRQLRLAASDGSGNQTTSAPFRVDQRLFVLGAGDALAVSPTRISTIDGDAVPNFPVEAFYTRDGRQSVGFEPRQYAFRLSHSITKPIVEYRLSYTSSAAPGATFTPATSRLGDFVLFWDARTLPPADYNVTIAAVDVDGTIFTDTVEFIAKPIVTAEGCLADAARSVASVTFTVKGPENVTALMSRGQLQWVSREFGVVEQQLSVPTGDAEQQADGSWTYATELSVASLLHCSYELRLQTTSSAGIPVRAVTDIDICALQLVEPAVSGAIASVNIASTFRKPLSRVEVRSVSPSLSLATVLGSATRLTAYFPHAPFAPGQIVQLIARATFADGTINDMPAAALCDGAPVALTIPAGELKLENPTASEPSASCQSFSPVYSASLTGEVAAGRTAASLTAGLRSLASLSETSVPVSSFDAGSAEASGTVAVDTAPLAEGQYLLRGRLVDNLGRAIESAPRTLLVDKTAPVLELTAPQPGALLCPAMRPGPDGSMRRFISVAGAVQDQWLVQWSVFRGTGTDAVSVYDSPSTGPGPVSLLGPLTELDVTDWRPGDTTLSLRAKDASRAVTCDSPVQFRLAAPVKFTNAEPVPRVFSPDGDAIIDTTGLSFFITEGASVTAVVRKEQATLGVALSGSFAEGSNTLDWDGRIQGAVLPDGPYSLVLTATDGCAASDLITLTTVIDTVAPIARIDSPLANEVVGPSFTVRGEATDANLASFELTLEDVAGTMVPVAVGFGASNRSGALASVSTTGLAPGGYVLRLKVTDQAGHVSMSERSVTVPLSTLIASADLSRDVASPNGDGVQDGLMLMAELKVPSASTVTLISAQGAISTVDPGTFRGAGPVQIDLSPFILALADGDFTVRFTAVAGGVSDSVDLAVTIDRAAPVLTVTAPTSNAVVGGGVGIDVEIGDETLSSWKVELSGPGGSQLLAAQGGNAVDGRVADLVLAEGTWSLTATALDRGGNRATTTVPFSVDTTVPATRFLAPVDQTVLGSTQSVAVVGQVSDSHLGQVTLTARGPDGVLRTLFSGAALPPGGSVTWDVAQQPQGLTELQLIATDLAGNRQTATIHVDIDRTAPVATIVQPSGGVLTTSSLDAVVSDAHLAGWSFDVEDSAGTNILHATGTKALSGTIAAFASLPPDGEYVARLSADDIAGNHSVDVVSFRVDTTPPAAPADLTALAAGLSSVLTWPSSVANDVATYRILRGTSPNALSAVASVAAASTTYSDAVGTEGMYYYAVIAVDGAGQLSGLSPVRLVKLDVTPPSASIDRPTSGSALAGLSPVVISVQAADLQSWRLELGQGLTPTSFTQLAAGSFAVLAGQVALLDAAQLPTSVPHTLRLTATDESGNSTSRVVVFTVDDLPPGTPQFTSWSLTGANSVVLEWSQVSASDLRGYLLFRDGLPVKNGVSPDSPLDSFIVSLTSATDDQVPDGLHSYTVAAIDWAGNISPTSTPISIRVDGHVPVALIESPTHLARVAGATAIVARCDDLDVASVQFQYREAGVGPFLNLGAPVTVPPFSAMFDPSLVAGKVVEVRAVATDVGGQTDSAPRSRHFFVEQAPTPVNVTTAFTQTELNLSWTNTNATGLIAGFDVRRNGASVLSAPANPQGTAWATSGADPQTGADGMPWTYWQPASNATTESWAIEFGSATLTDLISLDLSGNQVVGIWGKVYGHWVPLNEQVWTGGSGHVDFVLNPPLALEGVRVDFPPYAWAMVAEVLARAAPGTTTTSVIDSYPGMESRTYDVVARTAAGGEATTTVTVTPTAPSLIAWSQSVLASPYLLKGENAPPGSLVQIFRGGVAAEQTVAAADGTFQVLVATAPGTNAFRAAAQLSAGKWSRQSEELLVEQTFGVLSLLDVTGSNVRLRLAAAGAPSDIGYWAVMTIPPGASSPSEISGFGQTGGEIVLYNLWNGAWTFWAEPRSSLGPRAASNQVSAVVAVPKLAAPVLSGAAYAAGGAVSLTWTAVSGTYYYRVERATNPAGPFALHSATQSTAVDDFGLQNGRSYYYRVAAVDQINNTGSYSNVLELVPRESIPPAAPVFTSPTVAGVPVVVLTTAVAVSGTAEPGSTVTLFVDGQPLIGVITSPTASFTATLALAAGTHVITATARDASGNEGPAAAPISVTAMIPTLNLALSGAVTPSSPAAGSAVAFVASVANNGAVAAQNISVSATFIGSDGVSVVLPPQTFASIAAGTTGAATFVLPTGSLTGAQLVRAVISPTNQTIDVPFAIGNVAPLSLSATASKSQVGPDETIDVALAITNYASSSTVTPIVQLLDASGAVVSQPSVTVQNIAVGATASLSVPVSSGRIVPGTYTVRAAASSSTAASLVEQLLPLTISAERAATITLTTTRSVYRTDETVVMSARITNSSRNAELSGASARIELLDASGVVAFTSGNLTLPTLSIGATATRSASAAGLAAGSYTARVTLSDAVGTLSQASAAIRIDAVPSLTGAVSGAAVVALGEPATLNWQTQNVGAGDALAVSVTLLLKDSSGAIRKSAAVYSGDVLAAAQVSGSTTFTTADLELGNYAAVLVATIGSAAPTVLASHALQVADKSAPALTVLTPAPLTWFTGAALVRVQAVDAESGTSAVRVSVGGGAPVALSVESGTSVDGIWSGVVTLPVEGLNSLVISAVDGRGNDGIVAQTSSNPVALSVRRDSIAPVVTVSGVTGGSLVASAVAPVVIFTDLNLAASSLTIDGAPAASGSTVSGDGQHSLVATASDLAGNTTVQSLTFEIDATGPDIRVAGVTDGQVTAAPSVAPEFVALDAHSPQATATLNGAAFSSGTAVTAEGDHVLVVTATDALGNSSTVTVRFTIDRTAPVITLTGVQDGEYRAGSVTPSFSATDAHLAGVLGTLNGTSLSSGQGVVADGGYSLEVVAIDAAGNRATRLVRFTIDTANPVITVSGVTNGQLSALPLSPAISVTDATQTQVVAQLDGAALVSGASVANDGDHHLVVTATDAAGNSATLSMTFAIDSTPPVISITGVLANQINPAGSAATVTITDAHPGSSTVELDGAAYVSGAAIPDGAHTLAVWAEDAAGNSAQTAVSLTVASSNSGATVAIDRIDPARSVLALTRAGRCALGAKDAARIKSFLTTYSRAALVTVETDELRFLTALRSGLYRSIILLSVDDGAPGCSESGSLSMVAADNSAALRRAIHDEVTEGTFAGRFGVVAIRSRMENVPALGELLGVQFAGQSAGTTATVDASLGSKTLKLVGLAVNVANAATPHCTYAPGAATCAAENGFGHGRAVTVGFDLTAATPVADAAAVLDAALTLVQPTRVDSAAGGVATMKVTLADATASLSATVRESLQSPLRILHAAPVATLSNAQLQADWATSLTPGSAQHFLTWVRLPETAGAWSVNAEVLQSGATIASASTSLGTSVTRAQLDSSLAAAIATLSSSGTTGAIRLKLERTVASVQARPGTDDAQREANIAELLDAARSCGGLSASDSLNVRARIGELISYWEARWFDD